MTCLAPTPAADLLHIAANALAVLAPPCVRYIGDIHGKRHLYEAALDGCRESVQIGDFGYGFYETGDPYLLGWPGGNNDRFIRGNHDNPRVCSQRPHHIDSGFERGVFYVGGGRSIDWAERTPGVDWWPDEEHSYSELRVLIDIYQTHRPARVVSHEAPASIARQFFPNNFPPGPSRTSNALDAMLGLHRPKEWVFGHWHLPRDEVIDGTRFICLPEGGWVDLPNISY
jgi:hypothetical protein